MSRQVTYTCDRCKAEIHDGQVYTCEVTVPAVPAPTSPYASLTRRVTHHHCHECALHVSVELGIYEKALVFP